MSDEPPSTASSLLVDLPNWVGDVVMALPAVARLAAGGPVTLHCRPPVARLLGSIFPACRVVASERHASPWSTARRLMAGGGRFGQAVTLRHSTRAKLLLLLTARRRLGSRGGGGGLLLTKAVTVDRDRPQVHDADRLLDVLGLPPADPEWRPEVPADLVAEGAAALERHGVRGGRVLGLVPSAAWGPSKRWPAESFGRLARRALDTGLQPLVLGGPGEETVAKEVSRAAAERIPLVGPEMDVAGLFGALSLMTAVVSNDSGPMHLAALAGVPVVALFGPTDPRRTVPLGTGHRVLWRGLDCAPCFKPVCPLGHQDCLRGITPGEVFEAVRSLMS